MLVSSSFTTLVYILFERSIRVNVGYLFSISCSEPAMYIQISPPHVVVNSRTKEKLKKNNREMELQFLKLFTNSMLHELVANECN